VKKLLNNLGYGYLSNETNFDINYLPVLKQRLLDQYVQEWSETIANHQKLKFYSLFETEFSFEKYLTVVEKVPIDKQFLDLDCRHII
jgi:hypothetical protein